MAYDGARPADSDYISAGPALIRENQRALKEDGIGNAGTLGGKAPGNASGNIPISNGTKCEDLNADKLDGKDASEFAGASHNHNAATANDDGFMANTDKQKLTGIQAGAEVNQNAFSIITVRNGGLFYNVLAASKTDTFQLLDGANITITPDTVNKTITIAVSGIVASAYYASNAGNASYLGGYAASAFAAAGHTSHTGETSSIAATGYKKFADGMIINWGLVSDINAGSTKSLTFALAFPNNIHSIALASRDNAGFYGAAVEFYDYAPNRASVTLVNRSTTIKSCYVIAIGN